MLIDRPATLGSNTAVPSPAEPIIDAPPTDDPPSPDKPDRRTQRGHARQRAQVDAARDLFIAHGYRGTTLDAIIARAGGSRETIYRVFGGKHGLFAAIIAEGGRQLAESIVTPAALKLTPREELSRLGHQIAAVWLSDEGRAINRVVISEGFDAPDLVESWYRNTAELSIIALAHYLDAQTAAGRLAPLDSRLVARQFIVLLMGELAFPRVAGEPGPAGCEVQVARCVDLILSAYQRIAPES